jgi:hypothetical protein
MRWRTRGTRLAVALAGTAMALSALPAVAAGDSMVDGLGDWSVDPIFTVGETISGYTPPGVLDGLGAYDLDDDTVRVLANHELGFNRGYAYAVSENGFDLVGARVSYFDIDKDTRVVVGSGLAYDTIYDANGDLAPDGFLDRDIPVDGFSRFCSAGLFEPNQFGKGRGLADRIFFTGEEDGGTFNPIGGAEWALDVENGELWAVPALGRGAWENVTILDTGSRSTVAVLLADDSSPFDADGDGQAEAAPLYLYVGEKDPSSGDFLARNGLSDGKLFVWVPNNGKTTPLEFRGAGTLSGKWVEVDNSQDISMASDDGSTGYDKYGYPTQRNLWAQAEALGAFGFSRPEDVATNPKKGNEAVLASTGVDTYAVDPATGDGADTFGTIYTVKTNFTNMTAQVRIIYDGDADPTRALRSPDNLDWADDGRIYVQEDKAEDDTLGTGEPLFGPGAVNQSEAGIVRMDKNGNKLERIAVIDRSVLLDPTTAGTPVDNRPEAGEWETSGILDVSSLFGEKKGTLFLFDVQAHGIEDQTGTNADSRINDDDLVEGGQLSFLSYED